MPISFDWSPPLNASGVSPSDWNSNPPCTGRHAEMTLIHGPAGASSCPYRVPASCVASVSPGPCAAYPGFLRSRRSSSPLRAERAIPDTRRPLRCLLAVHPFRRDPDEERRQRLHQPQHRHRPRPRHLLSRQTRLSASGSERQWIDRRFERDGGSSSSAAHTAQTNLNGTDANGRVWSVTGITLRLLAK